jgi:hypothetical protein
VQSLAKSWWKKFDRAQVDEIGKTYDQQAGAVRAAVREYLAKVRAGEISN